MKSHVTQALSRLLPRRNRPAAGTAGAVAPAGDYFARARQENSVLYAQWDTPDSPTDEDPEQLMREREEALRAFYFGTEDEQEPR